MAINTKAFIISILIFMIWNFIEILVIAKNQNFNDWRKFFSLFFRQCIAIIIFYTLGILFHKVF